MSYRFLNIVVHNNGATWPTGQPRYCTTCGIEGGRRQQATVIADLQYNRTKFQSPVGYCPDHIPDTITRSSSRSTNPDRSSSSA